jgi:hypothetical protein
MTTIPLFDDTKKCNAMRYLNEHGDEITRHEFVHELKEYAGVMLYVGGGYVPLAVAVLTLDSAKTRHVDEGAAVEAFEDWCRKNGRADEIGEDAEYLAKVKADPDNTPSPEYECIIQRIPHPVEGYLFEDQYQDLKIYEGATAFYIEYVPTGDECCMGDGVDSEFYPGMVKADYNTLMEAYFPEHFED